MQVETFEQVETVGGQAEELSSPEAMELIEVLGLQGQQQMFSRREVADGDVVTRSPYRTMTTEEQHVYSVLCPQQTDITAYASAPIPVRVLQVAAHAKPFFKSLQVWHPRDAQTKDPVLVGVQVTNRTFGNGLTFPQETRFILARWGEVLLPFAECVEEARAKLLASVNRQVASARRQLEAFDPTTAVDDFLAGGTGGEMFVSVSMTA